MINPFFKNHGPFTVKKIFDLLNIQFLDVSIDDEILDVKDLVSAENNNITFFHSKNMKNLHSKQKQHIA